MTGILFLTLFAYLIVGALFHHFAVVIVAKRRARNGDYDAIMYLAHRRAGGPAYHVVAAFWALAWPVGMTMATYCAVRHMSAPHGDHGASVG